MAGKITVKIVYDILGAPYFFNGNVMYFLIPMKTPIIILAQFVCAWISFEVVFLDWGESPTSIYQCRLTAVQRYYINKAHLDVSFFVVSFVL